MKPFIFTLFIVGLFSFYLPQDDGKLFLDTKRGWKEFCVGKSISDISSSIMFIGKDPKGNFGFQGYKYPSNFETASVQNIILSSKDSISINSVTINLGTVCSADFKSNTKFKDVTDKLIRVFGEVSSTDHNPNLGEYTFIWKGKKTVCGFSTKWDSVRRLYTGQIVFFPIINSIEERNNF